MPNKIFQKRKSKQKNEVKRKNAFREYNKFALIVSEGAKTEPQYFKELVNYLELDSYYISITGRECGSDPISIFNYGKERFEENPDYDHVLFVFDRDDHQNFHEAIAKIEGLQKKKKIYSNCNFLPITSNPCFELWLLLHYSKSSRPYYKIGEKSASKALISDLKKIPEFKDYEKNNAGYFGAIIEKLETAKLNAASLLKQATTDKTIYDINPSTQIHELVRVLEEISKHNSKTRS